MRRLGLCVFLCLRRCVGLLCLQVLVENCLLVWSASVDKCAEVRDSSVCLFFHTGHWKGHVPETFSSDLYDHVELLSKQTSSGHTLTHCLGLRRYFALLMTHYESPLRVVQFLALPSDTTSNSSKGKYPPGKGPLHIPPAH